GSDPAGLYETRARNSRVARVRFGTRRVPPGTVLLDAAIRFRAPATPAGRRTSRAQLLVEHEPPRGARYPRARGQHAAGATLLRDGPQWPARRVRGTPRGGRRANSLLRAASAPAGDRV